MSQKLKPGQGRGMPRGWEHYNLMATDGQAAYLLDRLAAQGPIVSADMAKGQKGDCSHSELMFYQEKGQFHAGIEFSEHLRHNQTGELATVQGGMPVYGRVFVTDTQIDAFCAEHPDKKPALAEAIKEYGPAGGQYYTTAKPPADGFYVRMDGAKRETYGNACNPKPLPLRLEGDRTMEGEMQRMAPVLERAKGLARDDLRDSHPMHRIYFELEKVPGMFKDSPVTPRGLVDPADVEKQTGFSMKDGKYADGYKLTAQLAMDYPFSSDMRDIKDAQRRGNPPSNAYLMTYNVGSEVRHDVAVSPEIAMRLMQSSKFVEQDGKIIGVTEAPVYEADHRNAMGTKRSAESVMDADYPESRSQAQNRACVRDLQAKPAKGTGYAIDLMSGVASAPQYEPDIAKHKRNAAILHDVWEKAQKKGSIEKAQGQAGQVQQQDDRDFSLPWAENYPF